MQRIENKIRELEILADTIAPERELIQVYITDDEITVNSDLFGKEITPRNGQTIESIKDEMSCRFDSPEFDTHFIFFTKRDN